LYFLVNVTQIFRTLRERREVALLPGEREVYAVANVLKQAISTQQARTLLAAAEPERLLRPGEQIVTRDERGEHPIGLVLVLSGCLRVEADGQSVERYSWYGYYRDTADTSASVLTAVEPSRVLLWSSQRLEHMLASDADLSARVHALWIDDMGRKLSQAFARYI